MIFGIGEKLSKRAQELRNRTLEQMLKLTTSGFGLVAALAWNELIKEIVTVYIKPIAGEDSGLISLVIYAVIVTILAVVVTVNLSGLVKKS